MCRCSLLLGFNNTCKCFLSYIMFFFQFSYKHVNCRQLLPLGNMTMSFPADRSLRGYRSLLPPAMKSVFRAESLKVK